MVITGSKKQMSYWTKLKLFRQYKKTLKLNKKFLKEHHNLNIDWIFRMWTVYIVPIEERYNVEQYGIKYLNELVHKYLNTIDKTLLKLNLLEVVGLTNADIIDDFNVRIVLSFKFFNLVRRANIKIISVLILLVILIISMIILF
jgi:hypothetical protein